MSPDENTESLEEVLRDAENFFGDLTQKMLDHTEKKDYTSQQKKEAITEFYRENLSTLSKTEVGETAEKIKAEADELNLPEETIAGFCITEKLDQKSSLLISRDETLLKTVKSEEEKVDNLEKSSMLRKFITSRNTDVYNLRDQLNQYKSSVHGFQAIKKLSEKFDLGKDPVTTIEMLEDQAQHRANKVEDIIDKGGKNPGEAVRKLKELTEDFYEDSKKISQEVVNVKKQQQEREKQIEEYRINN